MKGGFRILLAIMILFSLTGCKGKTDGDITIDKGDSINLAKKK